MVSEQTLQLFTWSKDLLFIYTAACPRIQFKEGKTEIKTRELAIGVSAAECIEKDAQCIQSELQIHWAVIFLGTDR